MLRTPGSWELLSLLWHVHADVHRYCLLWEMHFFLTDFVLTDKWCVHCDSLSYVVLFDRCCSRLQMLFAFTYVVLVYRWLSWTSCRNRSWVTRTRSSTHSATAGRRNRPSSEGSSYVPPNVSSEQWLTYQSWTLLEALRVICWFLKNKKDSYCGAVFKKN